QLPLLPCSWSCHHVISTHPIPPQSSFAAYTLAHTLLLVPGPFSSSHPIARPPPACLLLATTCPLSTQPVSVSSLTDVAYKFHGRRGQRLRHDQTSSPMILPCLRLVMLTGFQPQHPSSHQPDDRGIRRIARD
ncbi:hypothetical protein CH063_02027, partial [Colletotrichum higginsianum]